MPRVWLLLRKLEKDHQARPCRFGTTPAMLRWIEAQIKSKSGGREKREGGRTRCPHKHETVGSDQSTRARGPEGDWTSGMNRELLYVLYDARRA